MRARTRAAPGSQGLEIPFFGNGRSLGSQRLLVEADTGQQGLPNIRWQERHSPGPDGWVDFEVNNPVPGSGASPNDSALWLGGLPGEVTRSLGGIGSKLADRVSVKDFGAVGDGVALDTAAIQAAINTGRQVHIPPGRYLVRGLVPYAGKLDLVLETGAILDGGAVAGADGPTGTAGHCIALNGNLTLLRIAGGTIENYNGFAAAITNKLDTIDRVELLGGTRISNVRGGWRIGCRVKSALVESPYIRAVKNNDKAIALQLGDPDSITVRGEQGNYVILQPDIEEVVATVDTEVHGIQLSGWDGLISGGRVSDVYCTAVPAVKGGAEHIYAKMAGLVHDSVTVIDKGNGYMGEGMIAQKGGDPTAAAPKGYGQRTINCRLVSERASATGAPESGVAMLSSDGICSGCEFLGLTGENCVYVGGAGRNKATNNQMRACKTQRIARIVNPNQGEFSGNKAVDFLGPLTGAGAQFVQVNVNVASTGVVIADNDFRYGAAMLASVTNFVDFKFIFTASAVLDVANVAGNTTRAAPKATCRAFEVSGAGTLSLLALQGNVELTGGATGYTAVTTTVTAKFEESNSWNPAIGASSLSLLDYIPSTEHAAIRNLTSTYDCVAALRTAVAAAAGRKVVVPGPGKYFLQQTGITYQATAIVDNVKCSVVCEPGAYFETATPDGIHATFLRVRGGPNLEYDLDWRDTNADYLAPDAFVEGCDVVLLDPRDSPISNPVVRVKAFAAASPLLCYGGEGVLHPVLNLTADIDAESSVYGLSMQNCIGYRANIRCKNVKRAHFLYSLWPVRNGFVNLDVEGQTNGFDCFNITAVANDIDNINCNYLCRDAVLYSPCALRKLADATRTISNVEINFKAPNATIKVPVYVRDQTAAGVDTTSGAPGDLRFRNVRCYGFITCSVVNGYLQYPQTIGFTTADIHRARRYFSSSVTPERNVWPADEDGWAWAWTGGSGGRTSWLMPAFGPDGLAWDIFIEASFKKLPGGISAPDMVYQKLLYRHGRSGGGLGQNGAKTLLDDVRTGAGAPVDPNITSVLNNAHVTTITHPAWTHDSSTRVWLRVKPEYGLEAPLP